MKYYSELTKKMYDTKKELDIAEKEAEEALSLAKKEKEEALARKKEEANEVSKAYTECVNLRKEYLAKINDADNNYWKLKNDFIKKYGSWHMSFYELDDEAKNEIDNTIRFIGQFIDEYFNRMR